MILQGDEEVSEYALDGLKQVMAIKSRVILPYLIPQVHQNDSIELETDAPQWSGLVWELYCKTSKSSRPQRATMVGKGGRECGRKAVWKHIPTIPDLFPTWSARSGS